MGDYALWDYSTKAMTFEGCTFNISGKGVNVYVEQPSTDARTVEVNGCTVNSDKAGKAFLNIKNSTQAFDVTLSGTNTVTGLEANGTTGSALYQVETTEVTETTGKPVAVKAKADDGTVTTLYEVKETVEASVAEVNGAKYKSLQAAVDAAKSGATVTLLADTRENVTVSKNAIVLDLNGHTLNGGTENAKPALTVDNKKVTLKDSSEAQTGTIKREDTADTKTSHYVIDIQGKNGFMIVESGKVENNSGIPGVKGSSLIRLGNDAELRQKFADALYEKASRDFSRDKMCERQMENYRHLLARFHRPKNERESIVICGAYGRGNAGDDAILEAIVQEMRQLDPERTICVMSRRPKETRLIYRTNAIYTFNVFSVLRKFRHAALYINGGGSLMQDVTSTRSIWYYCYTLYAAKKRGCKVMMYGCGIGPINRPGNRRMAARTFDASVDRITLRDDNSRALLAEMGVTRPDIRVSADPTIILTPAPREIVNIALEQSGIDPNGKYIGFGLRNWKGLDTALPEIAAAANYAYEKHGLTPVFVPIEFPSDLMPAERVGALLHCPWHAVRTRQPIEVTIGILSRMKTVVGIRLHSLMFSAGQGVPVVGMSYDIKVDGFLKYIGSRTCLQLSSVKAEPLCRLIDECVSGALDNEVHRTAEMLRERESENVKGAAKLLNISEN